jgi:transitional endoplasmic reticulum ATPase
MLDEALLRPGRLERHIYVPAPDEESRKKIFDVYLRDAHAILAKDISTDELVQQTGGYVGADIEALVREAKMGAMREFIRAMADKTEQERSDAIKNVMITKAHFVEAIGKVKASLDNDAIEKSERQAWEMLYNQEQRTTLEHAASVLKRAELAGGRTDTAAIDELRKQTFLRRKDFTEIRKQSEALETQLEKKREKK